MYGVSEFLGKYYYKCDMCHKREYNDKYKWIGYITNKELTICAKCAEREGGKKVWKEKNQRLKKLSQK